MSEVKKPERIPDTVSMLPTQRAWNKAYDRCMAYHDQELAKKDKTICMLKNLLETQGKVVGWVDDKPVTASEFYKSDKEMKLEGEVKELKAEIESKLEDIKLCRCNHGSSLRKINDDFFKCPRCGGLIVISSEQNPTIKQSLTVSGDVVKALKEENEAMKKKGSILCQSYGEALMTIKSMESENTALKALVGEMEEALSYLVSVEFSGSCEHNLAVLKAKQALRKEVDGE